MHGFKNIQQMREELTNLGIIELKNPTDVDKAITSNQGSMLLVINSVCGCAAGSARPAVALALKHSKLPNKLYTVFAGQDKEATEKARSYFREFPPSSPAMVILNKNKAVHMIHRHDIEGFSAEEIAQKLVSAFDQFC